MKKETAPAKQEIYVGATPFTSALIERFTSAAGQNYLPDLITSAPMIFGAQPDKVYGLKPEGWGMTADKLVQSLKDHEGKRLPIEVEIALLDAAGDLKKPSEKSDSPNYRSWNGGRMATMKSLAREWAKQQSAEMPVAQYLSNEELLNLPHFTHDSHSSGGASINILELTGLVVEGVRESVGTTINSLRELPYLIEEFLQYAKLHPYKVTFIVLAQIVLAKALTACGGTAPTQPPENPAMTQIVEAPIGNTVESPSTGIANPPRVESNATQAAPTAETQTPDRPTGINDLNLEPSGGSDEQKLAYLKELTSYKNEDGTTGSGLQDMEDWWILKMIRSGDLRDAATIEEGREIFKLGHRFVPNVASTFWGVHPQNINTGEIAYATDLNGVAFGTGIPVGVGSVAEFEMKWAKSPKGGVKQFLTSDKDGEYFSLVVLGADGKPMAWFDSLTGNMKLEAPAPEVDPNVIVDLGQGIWERPADMTFDLGKGPIKLEFASPETRTGMKRACDILSYKISEAGRLAGDQLYGLTGTPVTFDDWMKKAESNGGLMTGMYSLERNPDSNYTIGMVEPIVGEVNLNKCTLILHEPISDKTVSPFPGGISFASYWINYGTDESGGVVINLAPITTRDILGMPFVNPVKSDIENAEAMSQIMATFIENTERLLKTSFSNEIVLDGVEKSGSKRRIELSRQAMLALDVVKFIKNNPDAATQWFKLAE